MKQIKNKENFLRENVFDIIKIAITSCLVIVALCFNDNTVNIILCLSAFIISGYEIVIDSIKGILKGELLDENTLMIIASITAVIIGEFYEGVLILLLFNLGELLEDIATDNSRKKIVGLSEMKINTVLLVYDGGVKEVDPESVKVGSLIEVRTGDRVSIDGILIGKANLFDTKAVTGESQPRLIKSGEKVYSGFINIGEPSVIKTQVLYKDSTVERIISLIEGANSGKAKSQKFITKFAKIYTPIVVGVAVIIGVLPPLFDNMLFSKWIYKALSFLVISCPCALVISVPLSFFIGIGSLAKIGVLIKGSNYIDVLANVKVAVFDKTGTITKGEYNVEKVLTFGGFRQDEVMGLAKCLEQKSSHPISHAILKYKTGKSYNAKDVKEISGRGLVGKIDDEIYFVGNFAFMQDNGIEIKEYEDSVVYLCKNSTLIGVIFIKDSIKPKSKKTMKKLKKAGIERTVMLSGDKKEQAESVSKEVGIDLTYYELLPQEKTDKLKSIILNNKGKVLYCGDGINDSPSIAMADVGVAMGALGSEIAIESADVVILDDDIYKIPLAVNHSKKIKHIVKQNIICSISVKILLMILALIINLPVYLSVAGDVGVMLLAVLNSLRNFNIKTK